MLSVEDLRVTYGGVRAADGVTFEVGDSTVIGLIGPNGAGKSTTINAVTGVVKPTSGSVTLSGRPLTGASPQEIHAAGLSRTFQQAQLWSGMTVRQNLEMPLIALGRGREAKSQIGRVSDQLAIGDVLGLTPDELPYGRRRLVEVGRALISGPKVVLLDEPGAGLTPAEKRHLVAVLTDLAESGTSVLLVDHDMELVMNSCENVVVLDAGAVIAAGSPDEIRTNQKVVAVYLGGEAQ